MDRVDDADHHRVGCGAGSLRLSGHRIDVWTDNIGLHRYYENRGFKHVRTLDLADYPSGALFQRPATDWRGRKTAPVLTEKPQSLPTRQSRFEPFERILWPVLNEARI